jgi:hypothetical protein
MVVSLPARDLVYSKLGRKTQPSLFSSRKICLWTSSVCFLFLKACSSLYPLHCMARAILYSQPLCRRSLWVIGLSWKKETKERKKIHCSFLYLIVIKRKRRERESHWSRGRRVFSLTWSCSSSRRTSLHETSQSLSQGILIFDSPTTSQSEEKPSSFSFVSLGLR